MHMNIKHEKNKARFAVKNNLRHRNSPINRWKNLFVQPTHTTPTMHKKTATTKTSGVLELKHLSPR